MPKRQQLETCCGKSAFIIHFDTAFLKDHLKAFSTYGYINPPHYTKAGLLYLQKDRLVATCAFGSKRVNIKCGGQSCSQQIDEFEKLAERILSK